MPTDLAGKTEQSASTNGAPVVPLIKDAPLFIVGCAVEPTLSTCRHHSIPLSAAYNAPTELFTSVAVLILGIKIAESVKAIDKKMPIRNIVKITATPDSFVLGREYFIKITLSNGSAMNLYLKLLIA